MVVVEVIVVVAVVVVIAKVGGHKTGHRILWPMCGQKGAATKQAKEFCGRSVAEKGRPQNRPKMWPRTAAINYLAAPPRANMTHGTLGQHLGQELD